MWRAICRGRARQGIFIPVQENRGVINQAESDAVFGDFDQKKKNNVRQRENRG